MSGKADHRAPELLVVVDTEEEFDWSRPFSRKNVAVTSIAGQTAAHLIYDRLGVVPTYVTGYPVAAEPKAVDLLGGLRRDGRAEIGAHLHPWVTPPHYERVNTHNSYQRNLRPELERAKIETLTAQIEHAFGQAPTAFKAGRYGFGPATAGILSDLGYKVDCSFVPYTSFAADGGPVFYGCPDQPFWLDEPARLLEIPLTTGYIGPLAGLGHHVQKFFDDALAERLHLPGVLSRTNLLARSRLSPEGVSAAEQCRLLQSLVARGRRTLTLAYHSPSLVPGHTPYVRSDADLRAFLANIEEVLTFFRDSLGGTFTTLSKVHADYLAALESQAKQAA